MSAHISPIPIGALFALSGPFAALDATQLRGFLLAVGAVNAAGGVNGRPISPIIEDTAASPERALTIISRITGREGSLDIFGCSDSRLRKTITPLLERRGARLWYSAQFEGSELSPNVVYGGGCPNQHAGPLVDYLIGQGHGLVALVGSDYIFARETNRLAARRVKAGGGIVTAELYLPISCSDLQISSVIEALPLNTDALIVSLIGQDFLRFCAALRAFGRQVLVASIAASEADLPNGCDVLSGVLAVSSYFDCVETPESRIFLNKFRNRYGLNAAAGWHAANAYAQVMRFAAEEDNDVSWYGAAPMGDSVIDKSCNYIACRPRIARVGPNRRFEMVYEADTVISPDPYGLTYA